MVSREFRSNAIRFAERRSTRDIKGQLQDQVRRAQGQVKHHEGSPIGTVVRLDPSGEFGFLETGDGQENLLPPQQRARQCFSRLAVGSRVTYAEEAGNKGMQATTVTLLGKHGLRA